ncbi:MAG: PorT family protein [Marinilabiliaceae bacterium]|nr:PorT family protein [Marinilabiliaceae bacterium]
MNKKFAILVAFALVGFTATAQRGGDYDYEEPDKELVSEVNNNALYSGMQFHFGAKIGLNLTTYDSDVDDVQARIGQMGILCRWQWENWAIQPEVFYSRMGVRSLEKSIKWHPEETWRIKGQNIVGHDDLLNEDFKIMFLTDNIQVPIMFKYYLPVSIKGINIQAGPMISFNFDYTISSPSQHGYLNNYMFGTHTYRSGKVTGIESLRRVARDRNRVLAMANFGFGYDSKSGIGADVRMCMGLTPVFKSLYNTKSKDRVIAVSFYYVF